MPANSYILLTQEWEEFRLGNLLRNEDYMHGKDISWVSQAAPVIQSLTRNDEYIFDPFAGLGTTLLAAGISGRKSCGFEVDPARFALLEKRLSAHRGALENFPNVWLKNALADPYPEGIEAVITNPPYFHAGKQPRSGNIYGIDSYPDYLEQMERVIVKCVEALPAHGKLVVFCENIRDQENNMIPQAYDICKIMQKYCLLWDERIILYEKEVEKTNAQPLHTNRAHEYVLIGTPKSG